MKGFVIARPGSVQAEDYLADAERLLKALAGQRAPHRVLAQAEAELGNLWRAWEFWEFGTDAAGNDHDGEEARQGVQRVEAAAVELLQRLSRIWIGGTR